MPLVGTYSGGSASANSYDTVAELLSQLPDNTANLIVASDIRDSVYSLWTRIDDLQVLASQSASASSYYSNSAQVPVTIGGISAGMSFSGTYSMQQMFDMLLYPYIPLTCSLSGGNNREFGAGTVVSLVWSVVAGSSIITLINVNGTSPVPNGGNQNGVAGPFNSVANTTTTFGMTAYDGTTYVNASTSVTWSNRRYWGTSNVFGVLNDNQIQALGGITVVAGIGAGAGVGSGSELSTTRVQTRNGINGGGNYLAFAWPTSFGTPAFVINGLPNTAFTKVQGPYTFTNQYGYTASYDVWMSNTAQNSPITLFQIN